MKIKPVQIPGKGWDVTLPDGDMLCDGRAPYTLAQAQVAADNARRDYARHGIDAFKPQEAAPCN
jgi:hypothetical protein